MKVRINPEKTVQHTFIDMEVIRTILSFISTISTMKRSATAKRLLFCAHIFGFPVKLIGEESDGLVFKILLPPDAIPIVKKSIIMLEKDDIELIVDSKLNDLIDEITDKIIDGIDEKMKEGDE